MVCRPHKKGRIYRFKPDCKTPQTGTLIGLCLCAAVFVFSAIQLLAYAADYISARNASEALRSTYYAEQEAAPATSPPANTPAATATLTPTDIPAEIPSPVPTATPQPRLEAAPYPYNPYRIISSRFTKLRRQNSDIIGWLTINDLLDEAVVQRDNEYYLDRDYRGYHNKNGALFLEQTCDLSTRPYTYLIYGHNMRSGLMFGCLRNYEDITFYRNNPFISFDTLYEDGRYVIFAVATISTDAANWRYIDFAKLLSSSISHRRAALNALIRQSRYTSTLDVAPDDQLLLLITCVDDETDRRVIAARRIREDETEEALQKLVRRTTLR